MDGTPHVCSAEHAGWLSTSLRKLVTNPERILRGLVAEGDIAVDLGCGPGFFTLPLAGMVGETGRVIAVDVQEGMLTKVRARAEQAGLASRIDLCDCSPERIGLVGPADFALAFWMLHEVPDQQSLLNEVYGMLKDGGRFLFVEPAGHVSADRFRESIELAGKAGLFPIATPRLAFSRAKLFVRR